MKRTLLARELAGGGAAPWLTAAGNGRVRQLEVFFTALHMSRDHCKSSLSTDGGVTNKC